MKPWRWMARKHWRASRHPAFHRLRMSSCYGVRTLFAVSLRPWRSGKIGAWRDRTTVMRPMPRCWAIARLDQPWRCSLQTCAPGASRLAWRGHQPLGLAGIGGDELWHTLREEAAPTGRMPADEFSPRHLEADRAHAPREVRQVALIAAMDRGRRHGTAWAAQGWGRGRQLKEDICPPHSHFGEAHGASWWEPRCDKRLELLAFMAHNLFSYQEIPHLRAISPTLHKTPHSLRMDPY